MSTVRFRESDVKPFAAGAGEHMYSPAEALLSCKEAIALMKSGGEFFLAETRESLTSLADCLRYYAARAVAKVERRRCKNALSALTAATLARLRKAAAADPARQPPNRPCPCGSGKKYKRCCRDKNTAAFNENKCHMAAFLCAFAHDRRS